MSIQSKIYTKAKSHIGETYWALNCEREAAKNPFVCVTEGEWKCNLFVYEVILEAGFDIGTPNEANPLKYPVLTVTLKLSRPPGTSDWYDETVSGFRLIGEGDEGIENCIPGDIITDGIHMGIYAGNNDVINAGEDKVQITNLESGEWGNRHGYGYKNKPFKIFRIRY